MKLKQALYEYNPDVPFSDWMKKQANIWKELSTKGVVDKQDLSKFKKFGRFFDYYYKKNRHLPSTEEVMRFLA